MDKEYETNKSKKGFQWFLFVVIIPLLFTAIVGLVICYFAGVNVFGAAKDIGQKLPLVGNMIHTNGSNQKTASESDLVNLQGQVKDRDAQIQQLQNQLDSKNSDIEQAQLQNQRLQQQITDLNANKNASNLAFKDIVKTYATMSPTKAAPIIIKMNDAEAVRILSSLKAGALAAIMENMDPKDAAKYTQLLSNSSSSN